MGNLKNRFKNFIFSQDNITIKEEMECEFSFIHDDLYYIFESFRDDPYYFRILLPKMFDLSAENIKWVDSEIDKFSLNIKVARLIKFNNAVFAIADNFVYSTENTDHLFKRTLSCLRTLYDEFKQDYIDANQQNRQTTEDGKSSKS